MRKISKKTNKLINKYIINEQWDNAKQILNDELQISPNNHWLITQLSEVYYEMRDYETALKLSSRAIELEPDCPLALNDHATHLYMKDRDKEAIKIWKKLLNRKLKDIAYGDCGEGIEFAKSLKNDIRVRIGKCYLGLGKKQKALKYLQKYLKYRQADIFSNFTKKHVSLKIKEAKKL